AFPLVEGTVAHRVWHALRSAVRVRASLPVMHAAVESVVLDPVNPAVLAWERRSPGQSLVALHNFSEHPQVWPRWAVPLPGRLTDTLTGTAVDGDEPLVLGAYEVRWLV
ncbi:MAG: alpha-glucosidase C-terminal domain-containing protein, partial [Frankiales bacterium]|nr:alpha-glucosidase C-terminal domain-containing protein [Frankiales bacterium]